MAYAFTPGMRVQLLPHLDLWMRGAKYGTVRAESPQFPGFVRVKLDHPNIRQIYKFLPDLLEPADIADYRRALRDASWEFAALDLDGPQSSVDSMLQEFFNMANAEGYPLLGEAARVFVARLTRSR